MFYKSCQEEAFIQLLNSKYRYRVNIPDSATIKPSKLLALYKYLQCFTISAVTHLVINDDCAHLWVKKYLYYIKYICHLITMAELWIYRYTYIPIGYFFFNVF